MHDQVMKPDEPLSGAVAGGLETQQVFPGSMEGVWGCLQPRANPDLLTSRVIHQLWSSCSQPPRPSLESRLMNHTDWERTDMAERPQPRDEPLELGEQWHKPIPPNRWVGNSPMLGTWRPLQGPMPRAIYSAHWLGMQTE